MNWLDGKVASYDGATLKVTELFSKAINLPLFSMEIEWLWASILYTNLKGCPYTFVYIVYVLEKQI